MGKSLFLTDFQYRAFQQLYTSYPTKLFSFVYPWDYSICANWTDPHVKIWKVFFKHKLSQEFIDVLNEEMAQLIKNNAIHHANKLS